MRTTALIFLFLMIWIQAFAQYPAQLKLDHLTLEDGLSQSSGFAILQDSQGYMWFGTQNGLNKYNGYDFTVYKHVPGDSTTISSSHITYLYEDSRGDLWVGTSGAGLNLYNRDADNFTHFKYDYADHQKSISNNSVTSIIEDASGGFWIGTIEGLNFFDRATREFVHYYADDTDENTLSSSDITSLYVDSRDRLWIGTASGLNYWDNVTGTFGHHKKDSSISNSLDDNTVITLYEDHEENFWVGTSGGGLNLFDRDTEAFYNFKHDEDDPQSISGNTILSILEDSRGVLWVGIENEGLNIFDRDEGIFYHYRSNVSNPASLNHNSIYSLYENNDNILWIGTFSGGISYMDRKPPKFEYYKHDPFDPKPLSNNSVTSFLELDTGSFLVGTDGGGLNVFDREAHEFTTYRHNPDDSSTLPSDVILALHQDQKGRVWIGYYNGGITVYDPADETTKYYRYDPEDPYSLSNNHVYVIYEGEDGKLWFGTNGGGINVLDPETDRFERIGTGTPGTAVTRAIYKDTHGNFWVGSYGGGLIQVNKNDGSIINQYFEGPEGLTSNVVFTIHEDREENLWIGTHEGGLHLFDHENQTFTSYSVNDGLPSPSVLGILEDDRGNLWLSTGNGLAMFNPLTETFSNYNIEHGTQSSEFNVLAYYKDRDGYMYFGGINGFNRFHPDHVVMDEEIPPVVLTDFRIFNQPVPIGGEDSPLKKHISQTDHIELPHTASVLTFDYVTLNFNKHKGDRFAYMLEGFDSDWNYVDQRRSATYTNLDPGEYTFRVKAANIYGVWGEAERAVILTITPPFWQTFWFYLLCIVAFAGAVGGGMRWRVRSITEQNRRLEEEVARQTSELCEKNSELENTLIELKETRSELVDKAHKAGMADLATNVLHNIGNILNSVNVSATLIDETLKKSRLKNLKQANQLLKENSDDLENFILHDPKGKKLLNYYIKLEEPLDTQFEELKVQNGRLTENIKLIMDVVAAQQSFSKAGRIFERLSLEKLVEDTLMLQSATIERHGLTILKEYQPVDKVHVERSKIMHTLVNLLKNAKESMTDLEPDDKKLVLKIFRDEDYVCLSISDNGCGIPEEDMAKIFNHGFTTKSYGHGFGLHSCANYMQEMKGEIRVESEGTGKGTTVTLCFPKEDIMSNVTLITNDPDYPGKLQAKSVDIDLE